ncbi:hypothetical protein KUCAC02_004487, partial [Chaenocephalus aceratus]
SCGTAALFSVSLVEQTSSPVPTVVVHTASFMTLQTEHAAPTPVSNAVRRKWQYCHRPPLGSEKHLDDNCRLSEYRRLKTKILDLHDKRYMGSNIHGAHKDNMAARKHLVDLMFKRFDADNNGQIDASELSQVIKQERLSKDVSEAHYVYLLTLPDDQKVSVTTVTVGQSAVLTCAIAGERRPPILWKRNHQYLTSLNLADIN